MPDPDHVAAGRGFEVGCPTRRQPEMVSPTGPTCVAQDRLEQIMADHLRSFPHARSRVRHRAGLRRVGRARRRDDASPHVDGAKLAWVLNGWAAAPHTDTPTVDLVDRGLTFFTVAGSEWTRAGAALDVGVPVTVRAAREVTGELGDRPSARDAA
jgi:hypothetical protein